MSKWLFRRSNSESVKARTEQVTARPKRPRPRSTHEKDFEDVELAELETELPQVHEDGASSTSAEQGVLNDVIKEAHDKETKLLKKIHTQEQKLRQHEHDLRSKDDQVLALKVEIADLKSQLDEFSVHLQSSNTKHEDSTEDVDEHREKPTNKSSTQPQPQSMPSLSSRRPRSFDSLGAELAAATELSRKDAEIRILKEEISKLKEAPLTDSTDSCKDDVLNKELDEMKKENARLRKQVKAIEELYAVTGQEDDFDIVDKKSEVLVQKGEDIVALQDQVDEFRDDAYKAKQLQDHSQQQSKHVMELKQELGATQMTYDELKEYTQSLQGMVEDLEHTVDSLRGSLQRASASGGGSLQRANASSGGGTDQSYWEENLRANMAEIEDYKRKLREAERMESDELKKLDDQLLKLQGENASLERNVQSMAEECKEAHKELKELNTQLEVTRTEAAIYGEDFATERRDREKAHETMEKLKEQFATDLVLLTEQNRSLILELEAYQQGNLKEARALAQERETAQCHQSADLKEAHSEVQAKNVQVRQYKKQVDSLTSQVAELERHNTDLIQEMSRVCDEVVRLKKSKPRKGEKAAPLSEKLSELEYLYDNSCKEIKVLKDTKRALSGLNVELTNGNKKLTAEIQKLTDDNQKLERENQQHRKASMTLLQVDPPVRARLVCDSTPEGSAAVPSPGVISPTTPQTHGGTVESAEQEQIRHQLKENFEQQEAQKRQMLDKGLNDNNFEAGVGNFSSLPPQPIRQPQQRQQALVYENYTNTQPSSSGTSPLEPPNPMETTPGPMIQPHNLPQGYTPVSQAFSTALQTQTQSSPIPPPLIVSQQEETQSDANQSPVYYQSAPARIGPPFQQNIATTQDNPMTYPILTNDKKAAPNQQKGVSPALKPLPESPAEQSEEVERDLERGIDQEIQEVAADVVELIGNKRAKEVTNVDAPFDPNLVCPMCMKPFRIGEIQKFRKHVLDCKGSGATITEC